MSREFFERLLELGSKNEPFAVATVIQIEGSASAKPGFKAIIDSSGKTVSGWVGGGCAESAVRVEALKCMDDGRPRIITLDLTDEMSGVGMPCGGSMRIYIEPFLPNPELLIVGHGRIAQALAEIGKLLGFSITIHDPGAESRDFPTADRLIADDLDFSQINAGPNTYVVVATQHKGDHLSIKKALEGKAPYIALIASRKRSQLVFDYLLAAGVKPEELSLLHAPAGLDIGAVTPEEIALSIASEIVALRRGGTGRPMREAKGIGIETGETDIEKIDRILGSCAPAREEP